MEITNTGRQECVISEVRYFVEDMSENKSAFPEIFISDHDPLPAPLVGSAKTVLTRPIRDIPESFTLEVWVWTGGKPYKSGKYEVTDSTHRPIGSGGHGQAHSDVGKNHEGAGE